MKILLATSELHPYSKTGGLADMVAGLAKALARAGHDVRIVTPLYAGIQERFAGIEALDVPLELPLGGQRVKGRVWSLQPSDRPAVWFIDQPAFYHRPGLYQQNGVDYPDNAERFIFFSKAVAHLALHSPWIPDLVHAHEWQAGLVPLCLHHQRLLPDSGTVPRTCMTVHNLAYQGLFPAARYPLTNLPWDYFTPDGAEFYGQLGCLKAGLVFADSLTTVSPGYAREITTPEFGCGLDGLLRHRQTVLCGILNGADYEEWNSTSDPHLPHAYSAADLSGKTGNKLELQKEFGIPANPDIPLFGSISRLVEQKGVDLMLGALEEMLKSNIQFVSIGSGPPVFEKAFENLARRFPSQVGVRLGFDEGLSHRIEASCDFFLMPSRFEPCGLNQMYSLRYATIPIVRRTGGLDDTVIDIRDDADKANGIKFEQPSPRALAKGIRKALALYQEAPLLRLFRENAMAADFSLDRMAVDYLRIYRKAVQRDSVSS